MKILITGGAGFLGANLTRFLTRRPDYAVCVLDKKPLAAAAANIGEDVFALKNFSYWQGDILDDKTALNMTRNSDTVLHLAARRSVRESMEDPLPFFETNFNGSVSMLEAARAYPPEKFIHISASNVYGAAHSQPVTEDCALLPCEPYGGSKAAADAVVSCFSHAYGLASLVVRPFNIYGPLQQPERLLPLFITNAIDDKPLPVPGDGASAGDWMFVDDFCRAAEKIIQSDFDNLKGEIINLGTGKERTLNEIAGAVVKLLGKSESLIRFVQDSTEHPRHMVSSVAKTELLTGWKPSVNMEQGLEKTINWYLDNQDWWRQRKS